MANPVPPDQSGTNLTRHRLTGYVYDDGEGIYVYLDAKPVNVGATFAVPHYTEYARGRIPFGEYLDMLWALARSMSIRDVPFKQDGTVDLLNMKAFFQQEHDDNNVCWGTCTDPTNCPPPKRDNRCMVWACHNVSENEPKPDFKTWVIGKPVDGWPAWDWEGKHDLMEARSV